MIENKPLADRLLDCDKEEIEGILHEKFQKRYDEMMKPIWEEWEDKLINGDPDADKRRAGIIEVKLPKIMDEVKGLLKI